LHTNWKIDIWQLAKADPERNTDSKYLWIPIILSMDKRGFSLIDVNPADGDTDIKEFIYACLNPGSPNLLIQQVDADSMLGSITIPDCGDSAIQSPRYSDIQQRVLASCCKVASVPGLKPQMMLAELKTIKQHRYRSGTSGWIY